MPSCFEWLFSITDWNSFTFHTDRLSETVNFPHSPLNYQVAVAVAASHFWMKWSEMKFRGGGQSRSPRLSVCLSRWGAEATVKCSSSSSATSDGANVCVCLFLLCSRFSSLTQSPGTATAAAPAVVSPVFHFQRNESNSLSLPENERPPDIFYSGQLISDYSNPVPLIG